MPLNVRVLLFASYRELAGVPEVELALPDGATAVDAVAALRARGGGLATLPADPPVALNQAYVPSSTPLNNGDELALLPPVAGG